MIFAFYSYKGGVGRTQLVANLAAYLCYFEQKRILLMDWDLEAPGLHHYFKKSNTEIQKEGLIETLSKYVALVTRTEDRELALNEYPVFTENNIVNLDSFEEGVIDLIPAGKYSDFGTYKHEIVNFDWKRFYDLQGGKHYIEFLKENLRKLPYDLIFIDSRTGISDYAGICNIQMPDANILVVAPTNQNLEGCAEIAKSIVESPYVTSGKFRKDLIFPILSRIDMNAGKDKWQGAINKFEQYFGKYIEKTIDFDTYIEHTLLHHDAGVAFWENLLFEKNDERSYKFIPIGEKYKNIACMVRNVVENNRYNSQDLEETKKKLLKLIDDANYSSLFEEMDKVSIKLIHEYALNVLKNKFINGQIAPNFSEQLKSFVDRVNFKKSLFI